MDVRVKGNNSSTCLILAAEHIKMGTKEKKKVPSPVSVLQRI